jgi:hypothetical protein
MNSNNFQPQLLRAVLKKRIEDGSLVKGSKQGSYKFSRSSRKSIIADVEKRVNDIFINILIYYSNLLS